MTLVNKLIKEARSDPEFLRINQGQVRKIAAHMHSILYRRDVPIEELERSIRDGKVKMAGIPLRVG